MESELFGHEKGSFTGAANNESVNLSKPMEERFFWMIGDMSLSAQAKALAPYRENKITRIILISRSQWM
ncbi:MAG: sigma 54-interacting transcriptional regulator [Bacteroidia bacterium]